MILGILGEGKSVEAGLNETIKILKESKTPATITAQEMEYLTGTNILVAKGDVVIKQEDVWFTAQKITVNMETGDFEAEGNVVWVDPGGRFEGDFAKFNQKTGLGYILHGKGYLGPEQFVQGDFIQRLAPKELRLKNAVFSGCESCEGFRDWEIRSKDMYVYVDDTVEGANLTLWLKESLPVFYWPYLQAPATNRKSGFLIPRVGYSSGRGIYTQNAFFWAISGSQDMTFYLINESNRGIGGTIEYRYIWARGHQGEFQLHDFYQYDRPVGDTWYIKGKHTSDFDERTSLKIDVDYINNAKYERNTAEELFDRSKRYAISQAYLTENWDQVQVLALTKYVEDLAFSERNIPQRLPELRLTVTPIKLGPLPAYFDFYSNLVHFHRIEGFEVERLNVRPNVFVPLALGPYLTVTPQAGIRETLYDRNWKGDAGGFNRFSYEGKVTAQSRGAYAFGIGNYRFRMVWEPKVEYQYVPDVDSPRRFPHIDFEDFESQHNRLLYSLGTRLYMRNPGQFSESIELLSLSAANYYSFIGSTEQRFGPVLLRGVLNYPRYLRWSVLSVYDPNDQEVKRVNADLTFAPSPYFETHLSPAYIKDTDSLFFTYGLTVKPLKELKVRFVIRYDAQNQRLMERRMAITYEGCCWTLIFVYTRDRNLQGKEVNNFRVSLDLKNISSAIFK